MDFRFSDRWEGVSGSAIRAIFALLKDPEIISFAGGMPDPASFPYDLVNKYSNELLSGDTKTAILQYGPTGGYAPLIKNLAKAYNVSEDMIQITTGAQQAIDLIGKAFLDANDTILVENPTFLGSLQTFKLYGVNIVPVETDENGIIIEDLIEKIEKHNPKLLYVIPNFQNPTGITTTLERRQQISDIASEKNVVVIEDDPYGRLRLDGEHIPSIYSLNKTGHVVYVASFSKTISPGLRVGAAIGHPDIIRKVTVGTQSTSVHATMLSQAIVNKFLEEEKLEGHIENMCKVYKHKRDKMLSCLDEYMPSCVTHTVPQGGLFIWCTLPENINANELFKKAVEKKVAFVPGESFYCANAKTNTFRLNFSASNDEQIETGIKAIAETIKEFLN